jgi:hypothetical protein
MSDPMNEELDFNVGEDEQEATVEMNEDGSDATLAVEELLKKAGCSCRRRVRRLFG